MNFSQITYLLFTFALAAVFAGIIIYYYNPKRKLEVERPKHRMLENEEPEKNGDASPTHLPNVTKPH